jgi:hypothetical protein
MQAEVCEDHSVSDKNEEADFASEVSIVFGILLHFETNILSCVSVTKTQVWIDSWIY